MEYIYIYMSLSWYDIPKLVVPIRISLIEGCCHQGSYWTKDSCIVLYITNVNSEWCIALYIHIFITTSVFNNCTIQDKGSLRNRPFPFKYYFCFVKINIHTAVVTKCFVQQSNTSFSIYMCNIQNNTSFWIYTCIWSIYIYICLSVDTIFQNLWFL
jgi:hypothetical protein